MSLGLEHAGDPFHYYDRPTATARDRWIAVMALKTHTIQEQKKAANARAFTDWDLLKHRAHHARRAEGDAPAAGEAV